MFASLALIMLFPYQNSGSKYVSHEVLSSCRYTCRPQQEKGRYAKESDGLANFQPRASVLHLVEEGESHSYIRMSVVNYMHRRQNRTVGDCKRNQE